MTEICATNLPPIVVSFGLFSVRNRSWVDRNRTLKKTAQYADIARFVLILSCAVRKVSGTLSGDGGTCSLPVKCTYINKLQQHLNIVPLICILILRTSCHLLWHGFYWFVCVRKDNTFFADFQARGFVLTILIQNVKMFSEVQKPVQESPDEEHFHLNNS